MDSPVVLIHGPNGAGKTSVLSAIELALTQDVPSLARLDEGYKQHLVYKGAESSRIVVKTRGLRVHEGVAESVINGSAVKATGTLPADLARFYSERCFLAQSTLSRLLEIYQLSDARQSDSPLTEFVKDLLGLDQLDNLIDGLHDAGDVRRMRGRALTYWEVRDSIPKLEEQILRLKQQLSEIEKQQAAFEEEYRERIAKLAGEELGDLGAIDQNELLKEEQDQELLARIARGRRDMSALREKWEAERDGLSASQLEDQERRSRAADAALQAWRAVAGRKLDDELEKLTAYFSDLPSTSMRPVHARESTLQLVSEELERCQSLLGRNANDEKELSSIKQELDRISARLSMLDQQIAEGAQSSDDKAQALAAMLPHVVSDECPLCGRNYREVSTGSLGAKIQEQVALLTARAAELSKLSRERSEFISRHSALARSRDALQSRLLDPKERDHLKTRTARLQESHLVLVGLEAETREGERLIDSATREGRTLATLQATASLSQNTRDAMMGFFEILHLEPIGEKESINEALKRFATSVENLEATAIERQAIRRQASDSRAKIDSLAEREKAILADIGALRKRRDQLAHFKDSAESYITHARNLSKAARDARTSVVRRVFNNALNSLWRDLFVRLAPDEPFVPAFALPDDGSPVEAVLETAHRSGEKGGNPQAMLSAGNLNTAALTLFLALHLSVEPQLPWLVIDDPVQSMDEVHVAQFAALLRTLAKEHNRQIVIAVHEKPLFDYLTLELSPAFEGDRLITIELSREPDGATLMNYEPYVWHPDKAFAA